MTMTPDTDLGNNTPSSEMVELAQTLLAELKKAPRELRRIARKRRRFEKQLGKRWNKPLRLLEEFVLIATETGAAFNREYRNETVESGDPVVGVMTRSHARACQIASAILTLLKAGYADDAMARWRSLHELWVITSFIMANGQDLADRYRQHLTIERYKMACRVQDASERLGREPIPAKELDELRTERDRLVEKFGSEFNEEYGWAADALNDKRPNFSKIEAKLSLDHWRPEYRIASENVHAAAHGSYYRLGNHLIHQQFLLAGPSDQGLNHPGHCTTIALGGITANLLDARPTAAGSMICMALHALQDEIGAAFFRADRRLAEIASRSQTDDR